MIHQWVTLACEFCSYSFIVYSFVVGFLVAGRGSTWPAWLYLARVIAKWLSAPTPALTLLQATMEHDFNFYIAALACAQAFTWWFLRNKGDDDEWKKKLKRRVQQKVEAVAGRLVVVPTGAPA